MEFSKDYVFDRADGPGELKLIRRPVPVPNSNEVIVSMKAAGLNRSEYMFLTGTYVFQPVFPSKIGTEGAGIIYSLGDEVSGFEIGDEVCVTPNILPQEYGVMGEYVRVPKDALVHKPKQLSFEEAGSIWMALSTAYCGLVVNGGLKRDHGQTVLISAASSSVGVALIQMAKNHGAKVIVTTRTSQKADFLYEMGADYVIATENEDIVVMVNEYTNGKGFDIGFDMVAGEMLTKFAEAAGIGARIIAGGLLSMEVPEIPFFPLVMKNLTLGSFHVVIHLFRNPEVFETAKKHILEGIESGAYGAQIDKVFDFEHTAKAYEYLAGSTQRGKVVVTFKNNRDGIN